MTDFRPLSRSLSEQSGSRATSGQLGAVMNEPQRHFAVGFCCMRENLIMSILVSVDFAEINGALVKV